MSRVFFRTKSRSEILSLKLLPNFQIQKSLSPLKAGLQLVIDEHSIFFNNATLNTKPVDTMNLKFVVNQTLYLGMQ